MAPLHPSGAPGVDPTAVAATLSNSRPTPTLTAGSRSPSEESVSSPFDEPSMLLSTLSSAAPHLKAPLPLHPTRAKEKQSAPELAAEGTALIHQEFGQDNNQAYRYTSQHRTGAPLPAPFEEEPAYHVVIFTYLTYIVLIIIGHCRDFIGKRVFPKSYEHLMEHNGYAALNSDFDSFYTRRLKKRLDDCFARPVTGVCGRTVLCLDRASPDYFDSFKLTGTQTRCLNVSAYNYLGFAQSHGGCADAVETCLNTYGISSLGSRLGAGYLDLQKQSEDLVARFVGQDAATVVSMGFATNSTTIPAIAGPGTLIISDEYNHSSIRFGARISGAHIRQYRHNDMKKLEKLLRESISQGMPRTHRPWKKIIVIVEGLYSMEGTLVNLPDILRLKHRYKFHLYVDEAHSIGAIGPNGRGVCDYFGVNPKEVTILMGTFTKSFGAAGGYIAGSKDVVDRVRLLNHANNYGETLSPPVLTQIVASMSSIMGVGNKPDELALVPPFIAEGLPQQMLNGHEGLERLRRLAFNARYFSSGLRKLGFIIYGHRDSPIIPLLIFQPAKMPMFSRMMLDRSLALPPSQRRARAKLLADLGPDEKAKLVGVDNPALVIPEDLPSRPPINVVVVAYPATPLVSSRVRFCVSAAHTKKDMDDVLRACDEIGNLIHLKYGTGGPGGRWTIDMVVNRCEELVAWDGQSPI